MEAQGFSASILDSARGGATTRAFHRHLLDELRAKVGCDGACLRPGTRWPGSTAEYLDEDRRVTDGYVGGADAYRPGLARWCELSRGEEAFIDTEIYSTAERRRIALYGDIVIPCGVRSIMACPLVHDGAVVALIMLFRCGLARPFQADQAREITRHLPGIALAEVAMVRALSWADASPAAARDRTPLLAPRAARVAGLPARHSAVLDALLTGRSEKQIAAALALSPRTVHKYIEQVFRALDVHSRAELMALFLRRRPRAAASV